MNNSLKLVLMLSLSFFLLIISCQQRKTNKPKVETEIGAVEDGGTLVIGSAAEINDLNPITYSGTTNGEVVERLFVPLVEYGPDLQFVPKLAERWEFSPDFLSLTFFLRKDVLWSDGNPLTAHDVAYSFSLYYSPEVTYLGASTGELIDKWEVIDDYTIRFKFKEVYADELDDAGYSYVVPKHILGKIPPKEIKGSSFSINPIGCGPFKLEKWDRGQQWSIIPNENYYKGRPHLDRVLYRLMSDENIRLTSLKTGEIDLVAGITRKYKAELEREPFLNVLILTQPSYSYVGWNLKSPLFQSKKVRKALAMAVDRDYIIQTYLYGLAEYCNSPILPLHWAYNKNIKPLPYNLEKAKQLLSEDGWVDTDGDGYLDKDGKKFSFAIKVSNSNPTGVSICLYLQEQLKKIGVDVQPMPMEWNTYLDEVINKRNFDANLGGWRMPFTVNPRGAWHSKMADTPESNNYISFKNAEVDSLIDTARRTLAQDKRKILFDKFQEIIYEEQPYMFLYIPKSLNAINKRVKGVEVDIRGLYFNLENWWIPMKDRKKGEV